MRKYSTFFRMRFISGLQYRAAAIAGVATQFFWGFMMILMFQAFYEADSSAFPMSFEVLTSYIWLQQALLAMFHPWSFESDILQAITDGSIAYELCRPIQIYNMWLVKGMASRLSRTVLRCVPVLFVSIYSPKPYRLNLPVNVTGAFLFFISVLLGFLVVVAFGMMIYIACFYTISSSGIRIAIAGAVEFLSGAIIPIPFLPNSIRQFVELLPFASMQNVPLRIYVGDIRGMNILYRMGLQFFWLIVLVWLGRYLMRNALHRVVVQGG